MQADKRSQRIRLQCSARKGVLRLGHCEARLAGRDCSRRRAERQRVGNVTKVILGMILCVPVTSGRLIRCVAAAAIALSIWTLTPPTTGLGANDSRPVLAYYYALWDPDNFDRTIFQPEQPYNSDDLSVLQRHVQQAQTAGIDGFVMSWHGNGDRTDTNLAHILDIGQKAGFRATIHFETPLFWGVDDVVAQLTALYQNRINHPAFLRYQGRPVIFFWQVGMYDNATWSSIRSQVDPNHTAVWIADGDNFGVLGGDAWDGISPYAIAWSGNPAGQLASWAGKAQAAAPGKLWIPPVSPGCNDSAVRSTTCLQDRADGAYYQSTWDGAVATNPQWAVIVSTFNEWMESTQIEPSVQYGNQYLQLTRQNADRYHTTPPPSNDQG
jgi:Glycosyl hydrolase family 99